MERPLQKGTTQRESLQTANKTLRSCAAMGTSMQSNTARPVRTLSKLDHDRFLPIVRRIAMRMARRVPAEVTVQDLIGYGWVGLLEAFSRANGMPDAELEAYASYRVRGAMLDYLHSLDPMA